MLVTHTDSLISYNQCRSMKRCFQTKTSVNVLLLNIRELIKKFVLCINITTQLSLTTITKFNLITMIYFGFSYVNDIIENMKIVSFV